MNEMVSIPRDEYERLLSAAEDLAAMTAFDSARAELAAGREELLPASIVDRLIAGEAPVRVFRDFRGLTQSRLAENSGVNRVQIAEIEAGRKAGSIETIRRLATALGVLVDDLV